MKLISVKRNFSFLVLGMALSPIAMANEHSAEPAEASDQAQVAAPIEIKAVKSNDVVKKLIRSTASETESIKALSDEEARFHVAQVTSQKDLKVKKYDGSISLVEVYNGGIAMPFEAHLTLFDPIPQDGGDFGTSKTFSLGRSAGGMTLIDSKLYQIKPDEQVLSLAFSKASWNPDSDKTEKKIVRFRVNIHAGEVSSIAEISVKDK